MLHGRATCSAIFSFIARVAAVNARHSKDGLTSVIMKCLVGVLQMEGRHAALRRKSGDARHVSSESNVCMSECFVTVLLCVSLV